MAPRQPLNDQQRRLLKITARMPLASVANLASASGATEDRVRDMLGRLRSGGWVESVMRGMTERRQHRFFLTGQAVELLYVNDHRHPSPREEARAPDLAAFHPEGELPEDFQERFALDHDHPPHLEGPSDSPFAPGGDTEDQSDTGADHEHPPWTATSRGVEMSLRRLAMLEPVYRLAPDLISSGRVSRPVDDTAPSGEVRMTDFRLLRHGGFYHAVARYGEDAWTPFTYAGLHATERVIRRKEQHRFWGVDCYLSDEDRYLRIGNRTFYEDPDEQVEPSAQVVVAVDAWARELARNTLSGNTPTLFCTPDGRCSEAVDLRPLPGPGVRPIWPPHGGPAGVRRGVVATEPGLGGHRRQAGLPAIHDHRPVPRHAGLLAQGDRGRVFKRGIPPPAAVRGDRPGGGVRPPSLPVGDGDEAGGQHEPGAAGSDPASPRGLPGPLVPGARADAQRRGEPAGGALRQGGCRSGGGLAGRGERARPDPGAARPAGAGERGDPSGPGPITSSSSGRRCRPWT